MNLPARRKKRMQEEGYMTTNLFWNKIKTEAYTTFPVN
jgi:hypothetical protein